LLLCGIAAGCTASASEVEPPPDQLFYPTGMAVAPGDAYLFVANANSILQYSSGSISVVDLSLVDAVVQGWSTAQTIPANCSQDTDHLETLQCDETQFLNVGAGARIGNFATDIAVQDRGNGQLRLIVPTRGDPSISWVDWDGSELSCNDMATTSFALCDDAHRLVYVQNDPNLSLLPQEPFNAYADSVGNFAMVTHLTSGDISLVDSPPTGNAIIADLAEALFEPDPLTGLVGATGIAGRSPGANDIVYIGSRSENRIQTMTVGRPANGMLPYFVYGNWFFLDFIGGNAGLSSDTRGMHFSDGGNLLYVVNRNPPVMQIYNTALSETGFPANQAVGATPLCRDASTVTSFDAGDGDRAYVTCFDDGEIYVIDPRGLGSVADIIPVGRGPYAIAAAPSRNEIFVTNFLEDTIAVIDVSPTSPTRDRVVLRIGIPKPPPTSTDSSSTSSFPL
jgi:YVTN family beta-propeller protein